MYDFILGSNGFYLPGGIGYKRRNYSSRVQGTSGCKFSSTFIFFLEDNFLLISKFRKLNGAYTVVNKKCGNLLEHP